MQMQQSIKWLNHLFCMRPFTFISTFICATYLTGWLEYRQFALGTGSSVLIKMWLPSLVCFRDQRATVSILTSLLLGLGLGLLLHQALAVLSNSICFLPVLSMLPYEDVIRPRLNVSVPSQTFKKPDSWVVWCLAGGCSSAARFSFVSTWMGDRLLDA